MMTREHASTNTPWKLLSLGTAMLLMLLCLALAPQQAIAADALQPYTGFLSTESAVSTVSGALTTSTGSTASTITTQAKTKTITLYAKSATKGSKTLKASGLKAAKATWSSSKPAVAKVNAKGKVTARKAGKATITAKQGQRTFKFKIVVKNVTINKKKASLEPGDETTLKLIGDAIKSVKSSSPDVASISKKGVVKAKKPGTTTVTLTSKKGKKLTCTVTVKSIPVTSIECIDEVLEFDEGDEPVSIDVIVYPDNATDKTITYTTSDAKVATVDAWGTVTPVGGGSATITATSSNGKKATCEVVVVPALRIVGFQTNAAVTRANMEQDPWIAVFAPDVSLAALNDQIVPILSRANASYDVHLESYDDYCYGDIVISDGDETRSYTLSVYKEWYGLEVVSFAKNDIVTSFSIGEDTIYIYVLDSDPAVYMPKIVPTLGRESASYEIQTDGWGFPFISVTDGDETRLYNLEIHHDWQGLEVYDVYGGKDITYSGTVVTAEDLIDGGSIEFETDLDGVDVDTFKAQGVGFEFGPAVKTYDVIWDDDADRLMLELKDGNGRSRRIPIVFDYITDDGNMPRIAGWVDPPARYLNGSVFVGYNFAHAYWEIEATQCVEADGDGPYTVDQVKEWMDPIPSEGCTGEWSKRANGEWVYTVTRTSDGMARVYHLTLKHEYVN